MVSVHVDDVTRSCCLCPFVALSDSDLECHIDDFHSDELSRVKDLFKDSDPSLSDLTETDTTVDISASVLSPDSVKRNLFSANDFDFPVTATKKQLELDSEVSFNLDPESCVSTPMNESRVKVQKCESCSFVTKSEKILARHILCKHPLPVNLKMGDSERSKPKDETLADNSAASCVDCSTIVDETELMEHILINHIQEKTAERHEQKVVEKNFDSLIDFYTRAAPEYDETTSNLSTDGSGRRGRPKKAAKPKVSSEQTEDPLKKVERRGRPKKNAQQSSSGGVTSSIKVEDFKTSSAAKASKQDVVEASPKEGEDQAHSKLETPMSAPPSSADSYSTPENEPVSAPSQLSNLTKASKVSPNEMPKRAALLSALKLSPVEKDEDWEFEQAADKLEVDLAKCVNFLKKKDDKPKTRRTLQRHVQVEGGREKRGSKLTDDVSVNAATESSFNTTAEITCNTATESSFNTTAEITCNTATDSSFNTTANITCNTATVSSFNTTANMTCNTATNSSFNTTANMTCYTATDSSFNTTANKTCNTATDSSFNTTTDITCNTAPDRSFNEVTDSSFNLTADITSSTATAVSFCRTTNMTQGNSTATGHSFNVMKDMVAGTKKRCINTTAGSFNSVPTSELTCDYSSTLDNTFDTTKDSSFNMTRNGSFAAQKPFNAESSSTDTSKLMLNFVAQDNRIIASCNVFGKASNSETPERKNADKKMKPELDKPQESRKDLKRKRIEDDEVESNHKPRDLEKLRLLNKIEELKSELNEFEVTLSEKNNQISRMSGELETKSLQIKGLEMELQQLNLSRVMERTNFVQQISFSKRICLALLQNFDAIEKKVSEGKF